MPRLFETIVPRKLLRVELLIIIHCKKWHEVTVLNYQTIKKLYILGSGYKSTKCFLGH